jgi:hypothetical protein
MDDSTEVQNEAIEGAGFDLDQLPPSIASEEDAGTDVHLRGLDGALLYADKAKKQKLFIKMAGTYSKRFRRIADEQRDRQLKNRRREVTAEQLTQNQMELTSGCVVSWNITLNARPVPVTPENATMVFTRAPHWKEQCEEGMQDHAGFSKTASAS